MPTVKASTFADPADVAAFKKAKAAGKTDAQAFKVGDNGIGKWGDFTATETAAMCALPREDWEEKMGQGQRRARQKGRRYLQRKNGRRRTARHDARKS